MHEQLYHRKGYVVTGCQSAERHLFANTKD
jgi:hypothetical protein